MVDMAYMAIAKGSPCVVPSRERMVSPLMKSSDLDLYVLMRIVASEGHTCFTFLRATSLFSELNVLEASTKMITSVSAELKTSHMACIAAWHQFSWPAQSCNAPATSWTSSLMTEEMALLMIRRTVSPTPIGLMPGHLSKAINLLATKASMPLGSTYSVHNRLVVLAKEWQRSAQCGPNAVHRRFHPKPSIPKGPPAPSIFKAAVRIKAPSNLS